MLYIEESESLFFSILKVVSRVYRIAYPFVLQKYLNIKDDLLNNSFQNKKSRIKLKFLHSNILLNGQCHFTDALNVFILCEVFEIRLKYSNNICSIVLLEYKGVESPRINIKLNFCNDTFTSKVININRYTVSDMSHIRNYNRNIIIKKLSSYFIRKESGLLFSVRKLKNIKAVKKIYSFPNNNPIYDKNNEFSNYILGNSPSIKNADIDGVVAMYRFNEIDRIFNNGIDIDIRKNYKVLNKNFVFIYNEKRKKLKETNSINFTFLDTSIGALPFYIINPSQKNDEVFLCQIVEVLKSFKNYYENKLQVNHELYLRYKRNEHESSDKSIFKIKVLAGYEHLFFSFLNNNSICKSNGFFCYTEKFGCKNMFGDQSIEDIIKKITLILGSKNIKNVFLDLACPYFPDIKNIEPEKLIYVSFKKDSFFSISNEIKPYFYLLNTNLAAANIKFFKKIGDRIRKFGFLYKLNFYNPTLKHILKEFLKNVTFPKKAFLSTYLSICSSKYKSTLFIEELLAIKDSLEKIKSNNSEYRMEVTCKLTDIYQGLGFLSTIKKNQENFILADWNKIYEEIIKTLKLIIDFLAHKKDSYIEYVFYSVFFEVYLKNIIFTGRFGGSSIFSDNDFSYFRNSISNIPDTYTSFETLLLHLNNIHKNFMIKIISNCIAFHFNKEKLNTRKNTYLNNNLPILRNIINMYKIDGLGNFIDGMFKLINEDLVKKYKSNLEMINTILSLKDKNIQTIHIEKYIENTFLNYNLKGFLVNIEYLLSNYFYLNGLNVSLKTFKDDIIRNIKLHFSGKKYYYGIIFISQKKFGIKKLSYIDKDISSDFITYPTDAYNNLFHIITNSKSYNTHRALNWSLLDTALLFIGFKIYNTLFYGENKKFIFEEVIKDIRFAFIGSYSPQQLYDRHKWVLNKNRTSDSLRNTIIAKINEIQIENISIEMIILQIRRKKNINNISEIELDLKKLYLYYSCFGHYVIKNTEHESLYDFLNCEDIIIRKKQNFIYYKSNCIQNIQLALVEELEDDNVNAYEDAYNPIYNDSIFPIHPEMSVTENNNLSVIEDDNMSVIENNNLSVIENNNLSVIEDDNMYVIENNNLSVIEDDNMSVIEKNPVEKTNFNYILSLPFSSKPTIDIYNIHLPPLNTNFPLIQHLFYHLPLMYKSPKPNVMEVSIQQNNQKGQHMKSTSDLLQQPPTKSSANTSPSPSQEYIERPTAKNISVPHSPITPNQQIQHFPPAAVSLTKTLITKLTRKLNYLKTYQKYHVHGFSLYDLEKAMHTKKTQNKSVLLAYLNLMIERRVIVYRSVTSRSYRYFFI